MSRPTKIPDRPILDLHVLNDEHRHDTSPRRRETITGIYATAEHTLINADRQEAVKTTRQDFQMTMREPFTDAVEQPTGRTVIAFMSQVHFDPDMAAEIFVLKPTEAETTATT